MLGTAELNDEQWRDLLRPNWGSIPPTSSLAKLTPETIKGYGVMGAAGAKTGHLDAKTRELVAIAVAITLRCDGCIAVHADNARKLGASLEEVAEALCVAISVNAGAAIVYSTCTLDAYQASAEPTQSVDKE